MFMSFLGTVILAGMLFSAAGAEIDGSWKIVMDTKAGDQEKFAASEIQNYMEKILGKKLPIVKEGSPAIIVRSGKYGQEEWFLKHQSDGNILISGGLPRGIIYGADEFLEKGAGCLFAAPDCEFVPQKEKVFIPADFEVQGKPYYEKRDISYGLHANLSPKTQIFRLRRKCSSFFTPPELGSFERDAFHVHTYYMFVNDLKPGEMEDCLSLSKDGKRLLAKSNSGPGQLCLSNPKTVDLVVNKFEGLIQKQVNLTLHDSSYKGSPVPYVWVISQNDNSSYCVCPGCQALYKKYGSCSGAMVEFTNKVAERIEKKHPGFQIQAEAYQHTEQAPKGIKPRKNVIIRLAQLGGEWGQSLRRDSLRPLSHPNNVAARKNILDWAAISETTSIWDYWTLWTQPYAFPYTNVHSLAENLKFYTQKGKAKRFYAEADVFQGNILAGNFIDLRMYLAMKLLVDPETDEEKAIDAFMKVYYGPATETMRQLLDYMTKRMQDERCNIGMSGIRSSYLDKAFFLTCDKLFTEAEKAVAGHPEILSRIGQERISFDVTQMMKENRLGIPLDHATIETRLRRNYKDAVLRYITYEQAKMLKNVDNYVTICTMRVPVPEKFKKQNICFDLTWNKFSPESTGWTDMVDDPQAAGGKARCHSGISPRIGILELTEPDYHKRGLVIDIHDSGNEKSPAVLELKPDQLPKDEKYHWYKVGNCPITPYCAIRLHYSHRAAISLSGAFDPKEPNKRCEIWASVRLTGPSYTPGSTEQDAILIDRVLVLDKSGR